jgi:nitroreductase
MNTVDEIIRGRFACRRFTDRPVPKEMIEEILDLARFAPSASNTQPWHVYVLSSEAKEQVSRALLDAHYNHQDAHCPEQHSATPMPEAHALRREEFGGLFYDFLGIPRTDMEARAANTARNYSFFDAPVGLVFATDRRLGMPALVTMGSFLQNVMLAAHARGLDTCPQETIAKYHLVLRDVLDIPAEQIVACGMSMGYADEAALRNRPAMPRIPVSEFTKFVGF